MLMVFWTLVGFGTGVGYIFTNDDQDKLFRLLEALLAAFVIVGALFSILGIWQPDGSTDYNQW